MGLFAIPHAPPGAGKETPMADRMTLEVFTDFV